MPSWVSSGSIAKYHRAVKTLKDENVALKAQGKPEVEITDAAIKDLYLNKYGGLVLESDPVADEEAPATEEAPKKKK